MTNSACATVDPPVVASLTSAVTVTGDSPSDGLGESAMCVDTGPTPSVLGGGAAVSRNVIMPPKAVCSGSAVCWLSLSRCCAGSYTASLASGPVGMVTRASTVWPGSMTSVAA